MGITKFQFQQYAITSLFIALWYHCNLSAGVIVGGTDVPASSISTFTIHIDSPYYPGGVTEDISLSSGEFSIIRQQQEGLGDGSANSYIDTELIGLTLSGTSINLGGLNVRIGADNGVELGASIGRVNNVLTTTPGSSTPVGTEEFVSGNSFFDVFFEVDVGGSVFYNRDPHTLSATITEIPPVGSVHVPTAPVNLYLRVGSTNSLSDPIVGTAGGIHIITVPEPSSYSMLAVGLLGLVTVYRRPRS